MREEEEEEEEEKEDEEEEETSMHGANTLYNQKEKMLVNVKPTLVLEQFPGESSILHVLFSERSLSLRRYR